MVSLSDAAPVVLSTAASETPAAVLAKTESYRKAELATLTKYGEWSDVKDAVQTSLMWSVVYDPKQSLVSPNAPILVADCSSQRPTKMERSG